MKQAALITCHNIKIMVLFSRRMPQRWSLKNLDMMFW